MKIAMALARFVIYAAGGPAMTERMQMEAGGLVWGVARLAEDPSLAEEDPVMVLYGQRLDASVQWVMLPEDLGGNKAFVLATRSIHCPCGLHQVTALELSVKPWLVAECCLRGQFFWFSLQDKRND